MHPSAINVDGWTLRFTDRTAGDFSPDSTDVALRRTAVVGDQPVLWLRQTHGAKVVIVTGPDDVERCSGTAADAAVTTSSGLALSVVTADCAPIAVIAGDVGAVVHAGWQGLLHGVIEATIDTVRALASPATPVTAVLGPCIHPTSYRFGVDDLDRVAARYGNCVRARTADGMDALDMPAAVLAAFASRDVTVRRDAAADTSTPNWFSHRTRADRGRQALFLWRTT